MDILFSGPMVRAILDGSKTQTRRVAKPVRHPDLGNVYAPGALVLEHEPKHVIERACPHGRPGDRLWVRESCWIFGQWHVKGLRKNGKPSYRFKPIERRVRFDNPGHEAIGYLSAGPGWVWHPSIHMPRWASRITLEVTDVRIERLQGISEADAQAEGTSCHVCGRTMDGYGEDDCHCFHRKAGVIDFQRLWESINGPESWTANPWVWAITFRRVDERLP